MRTSSLFPRPLVGLSSINTWPTRPSLSVLLFLPRNSSALMSMLLTSHADSLSTTQRSSGVWSPCLHVATDPQLSIFFSPVLVYVNGSTARRRPTLLLFTTRGFAKRKNIPKLRDPMGVGGWVQVPLGIGGGIVTK